MSFSWLWNDLQQVRMWINFCELFLENCTFLCIYWPRYKFAMCHSFVVSLGSSQVVIQFNGLHSNTPLISNISIIMVIIMIEYLQHKKLHKSIYLHFFLLHVPFSSSNTAWVWCGNAQLQIMQGTFLLLLR